MAPVEDLLEKSLNELLEAELKKFQWLLKNDYKCLSRSEMEKADILDTVDKMVACFGPEKAVKTTVEILRKMNQNNLAEQIQNNNKPVTFTNIVPWTRNDFLQYSHQLNMDLNTTHKHLRLSERNRVITYNDQDQMYPDHPERFDQWSQVLCRESVCGRCYWEIEWSGECGPFLSVSYKSISRKGGGNECRFGYNDQSWSLFCCSSSYLFLHNKIETVLPVESISRRIGVYVDHSAGTLSFYSVSDTMILIRTVQTTFTQPLCPGFGVYKSSVKLF